MRLDDFTLASHSDEIDGHMGKVVASATIHTSDDDICDPTLTTLVLQVAEDVFLQAMSNALHNASAIETEAEHILEDVYRPTPCWCSHDCCGHRHGSATAKHINGTLYCVQISTSRNY